jgi:GNAT superfamily N-acetyltransferase
MTAIEIKPFSPGQEQVVSQLIKEVYDEFVAPDYSEKGNLFFYAFIDPEAIYSRQYIQNTILLAFRDGILAGMIEMRDNSRVSLLFTRKEFMHQGIAHKLLNEAISHCLIHNPNLKIISVHASPYSIPIYQKLGFIPISSMQEANGILYMPMELQLVQILPNL